jgi:hypothetical protein
VFGSNDLSSVSEVEKLVEAEMVEYDAKLVKSLMFSNPADKLCPEPVKRHSAAWLVSSEIEKSRMENLSQTKESCVESKLTMRELSSYGFDQVSHIALVVSTI